MQILITLGVVLLVFFAGAFLVGVIQGVRQTRQGIKSAKKPEEDSPLVRDIRFKVDALRQLQKELALPGVPVNVTQDRSTALLESRIGGVAAWPRGLAHPKPKGAFPFALLCQINLGDIPKLDEFPDTGLLQIFFATDDYYGLGFPTYEDGERDFNNDIHVVLHEDLSDMVAWQPIQDPDAALGLHGIREMFWPFDFDNWWESGLRLTFGPARLLEPAHDDYRIYDAYWDIENLWPNKEGFQEYSETWMKDTAQTYAMVIGGHPRFAQMDPRYYGEDLHQFDRCLVSCDSFNGAFMWGDVGTGSVLSTLNDLKTRRFDRVLSNYDCC